VEDLDDDVCLYRPDIDEVLVLNSSGGDVWRLAEGELTVEQITERIALFYGVSAVEVASDVSRVVADLIERGYLVDADVASAS
jgi:hypothetical protein